MADHKGSAPPSRFPGTAARKDYAPRHKTEVVKVSSKVHAALTVLVEQRTAALARRVTYSEVIEQLLETAAQQGRDDDQSQGQQAAE